MVDKKFTFYVSTESLDVIKSRDGVKVTGIALPYDKVSRNGFTYVTESIQKAAGTLIRKPVLFNHNSEKVIGHVVAAPTTSNSMHYEMNINPLAVNPETGVRFADSIARGDISSVSIQCMYDQEKSFMDPSGVTHAYISEFLELSIVTIPGFADTTASVVEAFKAKEGDNDVASGTHPDSEFDPSELALGIKIEGEHTSDPEEAKRIAKTHLLENPKYYSELQASGIEKGADSMEEKKQEAPAQEQKKEEAVAVVAPAVEATQVTVAKEEGEQPVDRLTKMEELLNRAIDMLTKMSEPKEADKPEEEEPAKEEDEEAQKPEENKPEADDEDKDKKVEEAIRKDKATVVVEAVREESKTLSDNDIREVFKNIR
jgi:phage head maturation protease